MLEFNSASSKSHCQIQTSSVPGADLKECLKACTSVKYKLNIDIAPVALFLILFRMSLILSIHLFLHLPLALWPDRIVCNALVGSLLCSIIMICAGWHYSFRRLEFGWMRNKSKVDRWVWMLRIFTMQKFNWYLVGAMIFWIFETCTLTCIFCLF